jgi:hypothetical protein
VNCAGAQQDGHAKPDLRPISGDSGNRASRISPHETSENAPATIFGKPRPSRTHLQDIPFRHNTQNRALRRGSGKATDRPDVSASMMPGLMASLCGTAEPSWSSMRQKRHPSCWMCPSAAEAPARAASRRCIPRLREMSKKPLARRGRKDSSRHHDSRRLSDSGGTAGPDSVLHGGGRGKKSPIPHC